MSVGFRLLVKENGQFEPFILVFSDIYLNIFVSFVLASHCHLKLMICCVIKESLLFKHTVLLLSL